MEGIIKLAEEKEEKNDDLNDTICIVSGEIDEDNSQKIIEWLIRQNQQEKEGKVLQMYINSTGGDLYQAFGIIDLMRISKYPIKTIGLGTVMSAAFLIFASGTKGMRYITKNCSIMCHQYSSTYEGKHHDLKSFTKEGELTNFRMLRLLQETSQLSTKEVKSKLLRPSDVWLSAEEVVKLNIADHIL